MGGKTFKFESIVYSLQREKLGKTLYDFHAINKFKARSALSNFIWVSGSHSGSNDYEHIQYNPLNF